MLSRTLNPSIAVGVSLLLLVGCAHARVQPTAVVRSAPIIAAVASASEEVPRPTSISRTALRGVLDAGPGRFLQRVELEPAFAGGRFVGFTVARWTSNTEPLSQGGLAVGDTVVRVNGRAIERPEQMFRVWEELSAAQELVVEYLHAQQRQELRYSITED